MTLTQLPPPLSPVSPVTLLADTVIDTEHLMLAGIDTAERGPLFSVSEMALFFFARSSHWVRWLETCNYPVPNPKKPGKMKPCSIAPTAHTPKLRKAHQATWRLVWEGELLLPLRTTSGARKYDLAMIEKIAHTLAANETIKIGQLRHALLLVKIQAEMNDYLAP